MKKYLIWICSFVFCITLALTGCASVSDVYVNGKAVYFEDITYFEGQVAKIGDYIYYGNGYADISQDDFDYSSASKYSGLKRIKADSLKYKSDVEDKNNTTPNGVESVSKKVAGYKNQYMFALGSYLYFTSANTHMTSNAESDFTQVSIFRIKFNGDGLEELGTFAHDDDSTLRAVKDGDNFYYLITEPVDDEKIDVYSIKIGDGKSDKKRIVENAESVTLCDQTSSLKNVIYTIDGEDFDTSTDCVKAVGLDGRELDDLDSGVAGVTITLNGRVGDNVFYSRVEDGVNEVFIKDITREGTFASGKKFHSTTKINDVVAIDEGYLFISDSSKAVMYKKDLNSDATLILSTSDYSDVLFVDGEYVYYSNSTSISRVSVRTGEKQTICSMTAIISGQCGYDGEYVYYFAQLENQDEDEEQDETYYMYRTDKEGNYFLIGKTK